MQMVINVRDSVTGAWHQITLERKGGTYEVRINGQLGEQRQLPVTNAAVNLYEHWPHGEIDG